MAYVHPFSQECTTSQLELFRIPSTVTAIESERYVHFKPSAALTSSNWIEFRIPGTEEFLDLSSIFLEVEVKVLKSDGTPLPTAVSADAQAPNLFEAIEPVNNLFSSLFQQVDLLLNNTLVTTATNLYHMRAYIDNLLYQSQEAKSTYMSSQFWFETAAERKAAIKRIYQGKTLKLIGPLHLDLAQQERLLLNLVDVSIRLNLTDSQMIFKILNQTGDRPKHSIINATLHVCRKKLFPDCEAGILTALGKETCKYFFNHTQMRHRILDAGSSTFFFDHLYPGTLPRRFIIGLMPVSAFNGSWTEDPFKFTSNTLIECRAYINSIQTPVPAIEMNMEDDDFARAYTLFFDAMYSHHPASKLSITRDQYKSHCTLFAWTLTPENDLEQSDTIGLIQRGHVRLDFRFNAALRSQLACVIYSHFPSVIQIDANREVMIESV